MDWQTVVIPSHPNFMGVVERRVLTSLVDLGFDDAQLFAVRLALEEAVTNAIKHGNKMDPSKKVTIRFKIDSEKVSFEVSDEGEGFDYNAVPDPTDDEHLELPHGRGLLLMRAYADEVTYNEAGNQVRLVMKLDQDRVEEGAL
ncbi:MAG: ATP-binding protein [Planctomycetota bacterium]